MSLLTVCCTKSDEAKAATVQEAGKTLVVYFTSSGNSQQIAETVKAQMPSADVIRIETVRETTNDEYIANNYALGNELLQKINDNPESADSYPAIKPVEKDCADYDNVIFVTPLWHSQMAAPAQSYLFQNRSKLAGKYFGMIVSIWSSGISTVVSNARRLVPDVVWMGESLWINHSNHSNRASLIQDWLPTLNFAGKQTTMDKMYITIDGLPTVAYFADKACLSPNYFGDLISKESGTTAQRHIQDAVIERSKQLLIETRLPVSEIAYQLGFEYPQHFSRLFKSRTGMTPNAYRLTA